MFDARIVGEVDAAAAEQRLGMMTNGATSSNCAALHDLPLQSIPARPNILTVVLLAGFIGRAIPPKAIGVPFMRER